MSKMEAWKRAKGDLANAREYVGMIGKPQPYTTAKANGYLHALKVTSQVHFQPSDGAANYHNGEAFDAALARVVQAEFARLSCQALALLENDAQTAGRVARAEVEQMLAEIDAPETAALSRAGGTDA